jgi:ribosome silencing factor RsfS/YbeB/iojap
VPFDKKPPRSKPHKRVEESAAGAPVAGSKRSAAAKAASKPRAARKAGPARKSSGAVKAAIPADATGTSKATGLAKTAGPAKSGAAPRARGVQTPAAATAALKSVILGALDDMKALEVKVLDVRGLTDIADYMVIASGTSDRHVRSVAQRVVEKTKEAGYRPHGCEGLADADWVLIDLHEMIVHVMLPRVREFYGLEKLWDMSAKRVARA